MKIIYSKEEIKHLPYRKSNLPLEDRIKDLLKRLTLDEKIRLLSGHRIFNTTPISRLGLPRFRMTDGPLGVAMHSSGLTKNTRFPCTKALSSTWNRELTQRFGECVAKEVIAVGRHCLLAPGINIDRTPFNGRTFEYFSEDPFLIKELVIPLVKAVQNQKIAACIKHYAANNQETFRKEIDAQIDERTLHEIYLRAFELIVKNADPWSVMTSYNKINGIYASEHDYLLRDLLINKWGFNGFIVSDWGATEHVELSTERCLKAGLSLEMPNAHKYSKELVNDALSKGIVAEEQLNNVLRRLLRIMGKTGLLDESITQSNGERNSLGHQRLAREIAEEGTVLLKNNNILPLDLENLSSIAVLGPNKNAKFGKLLYGGSSAVKPPYEITALKGVQNICGNKVKITTNPDGADIVLLFLGLNHDKEAGRKEFILSVLRRKKKMEIEYGYDSEGADRARLELPQEQIKLIKETVKLNPNTIVILINGSPISMSEWIDEVPAVVEAWYGGMEAGNAIANVLFGTVNPSGKLPITFPKSITDSPAHKTQRTYPGDLTEKKVYYEEGIFVGYRHYDKFDIYPLFPFGYGLSYTTFKFLAVTTDKQAFQALKDTITLSVEIQNVGEMAGAEVIQVYASHLSPKVERPIKELAGFEKVFLHPDERKIVRITILAQDLAYYDVQTHDWAVDPGRIKLLIGSSSRDIHLSCEIEYK